MSEFFRHLRPVEFDRKTGLINNSPYGGISFLLTPIGEKCYKYWIYICPLTFQFSAKTAIARLRQCKENNTVEWGTVNLDGRPIIEILIEDLSSADKLPSESTMIAYSILSQNEHAAFSRNKFLQMAKVDNEYEDD